MIQEYVKEKYGFKAYLLEETPKYGEFDDLFYMDDLLPWSDKFTASKVSKKTDYACLCNCPIRTVFIWINTHGGVFTYDG